MNGCRSLRPLAVTQETRYLPGFFAAAVAAASLAYATLPSRNVSEIGQNVASLKYGAAVRSFCVCIACGPVVMMSETKCVRSVVSGTAGYQPAGGGAKPTRTLHFLPSANDIPRPFSAVPELCSFDQIHNVFIVNITVVVRVVFICVAVDFLARANAGQRILKRPVLLSHQPHFSTATDFVTVLFEAFNQFVNRHVHRLPVGCFVRSRRCGWRVRNISAECRAVHSSLSTIRQIAENIFRRAGGLQNA